MARVYYVGDWAVLTDPVFAETPFHYSHKGLDIFNYGHWLKTALEGRVLAYTSDPAPHWGCNFVYWDGYGEFWRRCLGGVLKRGGERSPRPATPPRPRASGRRSGRG